MSRLAEALERAGQAPPPSPDAIEPDPVISAEAELDAEAAAEPAGAGEPIPAPESPVASMAVFNGFDSKVAERLVVTETVSLMSLEQYRNLAATLHHAQVDRGIKVVMVASALGGEGKTLTSVNLALTLSGSYRREVLLIDGDMRRPSIHSVFQVPNDVGLSNALRSDAQRKVSVVEISEYLSILPAGPPAPDPMNLLTSERIRTLLTQAAARYDWVIIDTPPVGLLTDANLLATMVDVSVLVIRAGMAPHRLISRAADTLGRDRIIGVVLNGVDPKKSDAPHYYPGYYYGPRPVAQQ
jgi:capsular exopolysaccharide synthesis family protein